MSIVRVTGFTVSADGFGAGPWQDRTHPLGLRGEELMEWSFETEAWRRRHGQPGGERGVDSAMAEQWFASIGAWIMGRNMLGPIRGPWGDDAWRGWWGEEPPFHAPVFVLTHHARRPLAMRTGTEFRFVDDGIGPALGRAGERAYHLILRRRGSSA